MGRIWIDAGSPEGVRTFKNPNGTRGPKIKNRCSGGPQERADLTGEEEEEEDEAEGIEGKRGEFFQRMGGFIGWVSKRILIWRENGDVCLCADGE